MNVVIELGIVSGPDGEAAILLQLPDGYVILPNPEDALRLAEDLTELASDLALAQARVRRRTTS